MHKFYVHFQFSLVFCTMKNNIITDRIFQANDMGQVDQLTKGILLNTLLLEDIGLGQEVAKDWRKRFNRRWTKSSRKREKFFMDNRDWLLEVLETEEKIEVDEGGKPNIM